MTHAIRIALAMLLALSAALATSVPAVAHLPGQPSFLKIDGKFVDYYAVKRTSVPQAIDLPQSMDVDYHLAGAAVRFELDKKLLAVAHDDVERMRFNWDFGDGARADGSSTEHTYAGAGTYILKITASIDGRQSKLIESTAMQIFPSAQHQHVRAYIRVNGREILNSTERLTARAGEPVEFSVATDPQGPDIQLVSWDFGDGRTDTGMTVSHTYAADYTEAFPMVRVSHGGTFFADNAAWLSNPEAGAGGMAIGAWYDDAKRYIESSMGGIFGAAGSGNGTNYGLALLILGFAVVAGALHSLTPGHGKTVLAALLIGRDNSGNKYRDLLILIVSITLAHTIVIYALGFVFLALNSSRSVNSLMPYFEWFSAALVFVLALYLLATGIRRYRRVRVHADAHEHGDEHSHGHGHNHEHTHEPKNRHIAALARRSDTWSLVIAGTGGGIVPCIDALSLLLLASGTGHPGFGLVLVAFFSIGLAGTIAALGLLLLAGKKRLLPKGSTEQKVAVYAPLVSGCIIIVLAVLLASAI